MRTAIALGSNLGDRLSHLRAGRDHLQRLHRGSSPLEVSPVYETDPVDCPPGSAAFLNAIVLLETGLDPFALLADLAEFERRQGRPEARAHNAPRPLDLDIIFAGDQCCTEPTLTLPHPRAHLRRFVLQPLCDLDPGCVLPGQAKTVGELLAAWPADPSVRLHTRSW